ncbi:hypothetical protein [Xanthomonas arboricola]|nr:hypothetical protein [Xanthomonas arboricola]
MSQVRANQRHLRRAGRPTTDARAGLQATEVGMVPVALSVAGRRQS